MGLFFTDEKSHPELNKLLIIVYLRRQAKSARYVLSIAYARLPSDNPSLYRVAASERFITQLRIQFRLYTRTMHVLDPQVLKQAVVDIRLRPRSGVAPWWVSLSIRRGVKSVLPLLSQFKT